MMCRKIYTEFDMISTFAYLRIIEEYRYFRYAFTDIRILSLISVKYNIILYIFYWFYLRFKI